MQCIKKNLYLIFMLFCLCILPSCATMIYSDPPGASIQEQVFPCTGGYYPKYSYVYVAEFDFSRQVTRTTKMRTPASVLPSNGTKGKHIAWRVIWPDGTVSEWRKKWRMNYRFIKSSYSKPNEEKPSYKFSNSKPVSK